MDTSAAALTKQGIARQQAGDTSGAISLFVQATQADPTYEMAWLWFSSCLTSAGEKRYCLDQALAANPQSAPAAKGLAQLGNVAPVRPAALGGEPPIAPPAELISDRPKHCPHCGAETIGTMQFCAACGKRISDPSGVPVAAPAKKKTPGWAYALVTLVCLGSCYFFLIAPVLFQVKRYDVTYRISGTTKAASLTIQNANEGSEQRDVNVPWEASFKAHDGQFLYLSAQNKWDAGTIKCEILLDGAVVRTAESNTGYGIASCSGKV